MKKFFSSPLGIALIGAVILVLQQALSSGEMDWKVIGWSALIAVIGAIGNFWKGKGLTITGIIGTVAFVFYTQYQSGEFTWTQFAITALIAVLTLAVPVPNSPPAEE